MGRDGSLYDCTGRSSKVWYKLILDSSISSGDTRSPKQHLDALQPQKQLDRLMHGTH